MGIKWYRNGKLVPDESLHEENKLVIAKLGFHIPFYNPGYDFSHGTLQKHSPGHKEKYFIGHMDDEGLFYMVDEISPNSPVSFLNKGCKLKEWNALTYTEIINIKLNNYLINNFENSRSWKYDYIKDIFGEDQIEFYK